MICHGEDVFLSVDLNKTKLYGYEMLIICGEDNRFVRSKFASMNVTNRVDFLGQVYVELR